MLKITPSISCLLFATIALTEGGASVEKVTSGKPGLVRNSKPRALTPAEAEPRRTKRIQTKVCVLD